MNARLGFGNTKRRFVYAVYSFGNKMFRCYHSTHDSDNKKTGIAVSRSPRPNGYNLKPLRFVTVSLLPFAVLRRCRLILSAALARTFAIAAFRSNLQLVTVKFAVG